jgi:hypothetical protein
MAGRRGLLLRHDGLGFLVSAHIGAEARHRRVRERKTNTWASTEREAAGRWSRAMRGPQSSKALGHLTVRAREGIKNSQFSLYFSMNTEIEFECGKIAKVLEKFGKFPGDRLCHLEQLLLLAL